MLSFPGAADISKLTPIKDVLPDHISFIQIKVVIAILGRRFGAGRSAGGAEDAPPAACPSQTCTAARAGGGGPGVGRGFHLFRLLITVILSGLDLFAAKEGN